MSLHNPILRGTSISGFFANGFHGKHDLRLPWHRQTHLKQIKVSCRFQVVALDIFGPLPIIDNSMEYTVVITDYFTKFTEAFASPNHTALTVVVKLITEVVLRYGCMEQIHSDMGAEFESNLFKEMYRLSGVKKSRTCPYRPQCDVVVERFNLTL